MVVSDDDSRAAKYETFSVGDEVTTRARIGLVLIQPHVIEKERLKVQFTAH